MAQNKLSFMSTIAQDPQSAKGMIIVLDRVVSASLPTHGSMNAVVTLDNQEFQTKLLPTTDDTHYFLYDETMQENLRKGVGDTVAVDIKQLQDVKS